jgi:hypothetical protein
MHHVCFLNCNVTSAENLNHVPQKYKKGIILLENTKKYYNPQCLLIYLFFKCI